MQMKVTTKLVLALGIIAVAPAVYAESREQTCQVTTYFSDAAMKSQVGSESTCPGMNRHTGRVTRFAYTEVLEQPDPLADPGALPCEWPLECTNESTTPTIRAEEVHEKPH
jgi:hypothetical protein